MKVGEKKVEMEVEMNFSTKFKMISVKTEINIICLWIIFYLSYTQLHFYFYQLYTENDCHMLEIHNTELADQGTYVCKIENTVGCTTASADLEVFGK